MEPQRKRATKPISKLINENTHNKLVWKKFRTKSMKKVQQNKILV